MNRHRLIGVVAWAIFGSVAWPISAQESPESASVHPPSWRQDAAEFFELHCTDCHGGGASEGGLDLETLDSDLQDESTFAIWERVFDRVIQGEMPPPDAGELTEPQIGTLRKVLFEPLHQSHAARKGTRLRRLNRREYENTLNDLFGTRIPLAGELPEDGRSHEFDNIGKALGISMVHLDQYLRAAESVMDAATETTSEPATPQTITASYADSREGEQFIGKLWEKLDDGSVVFYQRFGYPTGMLRGTGVRSPGRYRVRITGYAYRSDRPITMHVSGTSFARGSDKPTYGYMEMPPGPPTTVEFFADIPDRYMIQIEPCGLDPGSHQFRRDGLEGYEGPGLAIQNVELFGPIVESFPSRGHRLLYGSFERPMLKPRKGNRPAEFELRCQDEVDAVQETLDRLMPLAFRRPVQDAEKAPLVALFQDRRDQGDDLETALRATISAVLCSPDFLYLREPRGRLDDHAVASRLSYCFARSAPDDLLRNAANAGTLAQDADGLREQLHRHLEDARFDRFLVDFTDSWLNLREIEQTAPDQTLYPEFDAELQHAMLAETREFMRVMIQENRPVTDLVRSDFAMLNERLAKHYTVPGRDSFNDIIGPKIRKVKLSPNSLRGGCLTQGSVLKVSANGTNTSPVVRGVFVMERLLGQAPPPPPPGISGVEPDIRGASTLRELLDRHRDLESCRSCHAKIDPPGFALECFNPIGGYRDRFRSLGSGDRVTLSIRGRKVRYKLGPTVDCSGVLNETQAFDDFNSFRDLLVRQPRQLARAWVTKIATFASGREMGFSDRAVLESIVEQAAADGYRVTDLIEAVVLSDLFRRK